MVHFTRHILPNGLRVLLHEDHTTPLVAVNLTYYVGSRDENEEKTGFAHLFEHLMFAGSKNIPDFDDPLQCAGGENNAYTTNDYTTFYEILPANNIETALWLESDRMLSLSINKKSLDVQRKVVVEEFKETCLNEPYGDAWHHLSELLYQKHAYRWPVIGLVPQHIEDATLSDVQQFYKKWYTPSNAVLSIAGKINPEETLALVEKWFAAIPSGERPTRNLIQEPPQTSPRYKKVEAQVPVPAIFVAFRMPARLDPDFYAVDLISDVLAQGHSARLYRHLVKDKSIFSQIDAYITANIDPGVMVVEGRPAEGVSIEAATQAIWDELELLKKEPISDRELQKILNKFESTIVFSEMNALNKAQNLAFYEILDRAELMNEEVDIYLQISTQDLHRVANEILTKDNSATLIYVPMSNS